MVGRRGAAGRAGRRGVGQAVCDDGQASRHGASERAAVLPRFRASRPLRRWAGSSRLRAGRPPRRRRVGRRAARGVRQAGRCGTDEQAAAASGRQFAAPVSRPAAAHGPELPQRQHRRQSPWPSLALSPPCASPSAGLPSSSSLAMARFGRNSIRIIVHQSRPESAWFGSTGTRMSSSDDSCGKKASWPELVGMSIEEAKKIIMKDRPDVKIIEVFPVGTAVTEDLRFDRVRIFVNTVAEIPRIG
ncbi:hypothetical protein ZWY2020_032237 [Hordeum vulgare]|nr:hypothetical protein ZWY2020_032237 [Hordeum vulgare]